MTKKQNHRSFIWGCITISVLAITITGLSISVWAKPYNSKHDTVNAVVKSASDTTQTLIITNSAEYVLSESKQVDTLAINTAFLKKMRENGELLSSDEFASRITDYYNTLVAVLTALFVLFTIVTYMTIRSKFEGKFEEKAKELESKAKDLEDKQRQKIIEELRSMLNDSKQLDGVIKTAIGGHIEDTIPTKEEIDDLSSDMETCGKNITSLTTKLDDVKKKQQVLFTVVADLQEQVSEKATVYAELAVDNGAVAPDETITAEAEETDSEQNSPE